MRLSTVLFSSLFIFSFAFAQTDKKNLIVNGDLESPLAEGAKLPSGWSLFNKPEGAYTATLSDVASQGKKSIMLEGDGEFAVLSAARIELDGKHRYALQGKLKIEGDSAKATIKFDYFDAQGAWIGSTTVGDATAEEKDWQLINLRDRAEIDAPKAKTLSVGLALNGKGKVWFDDLSLIASDRKDSADLIDNGDFESSLGKRPAHWWVGMADGGKASATLSDDQPKQGKHCLHFKGDAEWAVASCGRFKFDKTKTYEVTGFVRTKSGAAQIKIDYFNGEEYLGSTYGEDVSDDEWTEKTVSSNDEFPSATHLAVTCVGTGEFDAKFDAITVSVK